MQKTNEVEKYELQDLSRPKDLRTTALGSTDYGSYTATAARDLRRLASASASLSPAPHPREVSVMSDEPSRAHTPRQRRHPTPDRAGHRS